MKVNFIIAEEIRAEAQNKLTILGFFAADTIILIKNRGAEEIPKNAAPALERLAILATISDVPNGIHKFRGNIFDPSGELYQPEMQYGEASIEAGYSHSIIIEFKPFIVKKPGVFRLEFFVDDVMFEYKFEIREQNPE